MKKRMSDPEYREKILLSISKKRQKYNGLNKRVKQLDMDGNVVKIWESMADVERAGIVTRQSVSLCCLGKMNSAKGYRWQFDV